MGVLLRGVPGILEAGDGAEELVWDPEFNDTELLPKNKKRIRILVDNRSVSVSTVMNSRCRREIKGEREK